MKIWRGITKFGLKYCDLPTMLDNVAFLLRPLLVNIDSRYNKPFPVIIYIMLPLMICAFIHAFVISAFWYVLVRSKEIGDNIHSMVVLSIAFASEISTTKFFYLVLNRWEVKQLVDNCLACDRLVEPGSRFSNNLLKKMRTVKKRAIGFGVTLMADGIIYILIPIFTPGRHVMDDKFPLYGLEPTFDSPNYELHFIIMSAAVIFTVYIPSIISGLLITITGYTESQMLSLAEELLAIWDDAEQYCHVAYNATITIGNHDVIKNDYVNERLKYIIKMHTFNKKLLRQTERIFRNALAVEFIILIISLIAILLGGLENTYIEIPFGFVQVAMDCFAGQKLIDAGVAFENALYDSKWENFDVSNRKLVLIMLMNSQKSMSLSAGGITPLNFAWLMTVIRQVYSAYTALRSMVNV